MRTRTRFARYSMAALALTAMALGGAATVAPAAHAGGWDTTYPFVIRPDYAPRFDLTIHKFLGAPTGQTGEVLVDRDQPGTQIDRPALSGVVFDVYLVGGVDLMTDQGWATVAQLRDHAVTADELAAGQISEGGESYTLTRAGTVTTDEAGEALFSTEQMGLYVVAENLSASTGIVNIVTGENVDSVSVTPSVPFLHTLPTNTVLEDGYRVVNGYAWVTHAYPKNQSDSVTKRVADKGTATSDGGRPLNAHQYEPVVYRIDTSITDGIPADQVGTYRVWDTLDDRLQYKSVEVSIGDTLLYAGDYTVSVDGQKVTVDLTRSGIAKAVAANDADPGGQVSTTIEAWAIQEGQSGIIPNTARFYPNAAYAEAHPDGMPSNPVESRYGDIIVTKVDSTDPGKRLAGVEFGVYADATPGDGVCGPWDTSGPVLSSGVSDEDGVAVLRGLQVSDYYDGAEQADLVTYCVREVKAPDGYRSLFSSVPVQIEAGSATADGPARAEVTIENTPVNGGVTLPDAGGAGGAALAGVGGLALAGVGVGVVTVAGRRRRVHAG